MNKKIALAILPAALFMTGCVSMAPKYEKSVNMVPIQFNTDGIYAHNKTGEINQEQLLWSNYINNENLKKIIETALINNKDLKIAAANIEAAKAQYGISQMDRLPMINGDISGARTRGQTGITEGYQASLGLAAFELDLFGRVKSLSDVALNSFLATNEAKKATELSVVSETAKAYYNLALAKSQLEIAQKTKVATEESLNIMKLRVEHGIATAKDKKDLESIYYLAQSDVLNYETQVAKSVNALKFLVGSDLDLNLLPNNIEELNEAIKDINVSVSSDILFKRPDVMAAEYQLLAANANIGAARAAFFPRISLTTNVGVASSELSSLFSNDNFKAWTFSPNIGIPIFDIAKNKANLKISEAQKEKMIAAYEKTVQQSFREVNDVLARKSTINSQIDFFNLHVQSNKDRLDLATKSYDAGVKGYLDVLNARTDLYKAELAAINLQKEKFYNFIDLYKVIGY